MIQCVTPKGRKMNKPSGNTILLIIVFVLGTVLFMTFFTGNHDKYKDLYFKEKLAAKDSAIAEKQRIIVSKDNQLLKADERISQLDNKDSLLALSFTRHQTVYKPINDELKNIPIHLARIRGNNDSIRNSFSKRE